MKTAARTLDLFEAFTAAKGPLSLSELARAMGAPVASCFGIVRTLEQRGYLYAIRSRRGLYPTRRLLDVARVIAMHDPVAERLGPAMTSLREATGETVILGKRMGDRVVYLDVLEAPQTVRYTACVGDLKPLHSSAIGKAILGSLDAAERRAVLSRLTLARVTPATITSRRALAADLDAGRARGWYATRGENVADVIAVAVPVVISQETFAVAVAGPMHRMAPRIEQHAAALLAARRAVDSAA
ncbi:MAG: helix-turn-helix domain-containing protein [Candidatus Rokubacteria bacterium]|nr:helix-turn-helix domain-containing protein [Candidatus Rokubacteria bacterium]